MAESIKIRLPNPEPISIRELEEKGKNPQLESEVEIENIPQTSEDIVHLIHDGMIEISLGGNDLSNEAQFIQRLDADIRQYCELRGIKPAPTMEQFADMLMENNPEKKVLSGFSLATDNFKTFYEFLTERYGIEKDSAEFVPDPQGTRRHAATMRAAENRALIDVKKAMRGFWTRVYLAIVKKAEAESLPQRLRTRLENIVNEMDGEVREQRLDALAHQISRLPAARTIVVTNALYAVLFGPIKGKAFTDDEREAFFTRLAVSAETIRPANEAGITPKRSSSRPSTN